MTPLNNNLSRPTFGTTPDTTESQTVNNDPKFAELVEKRKNRPEVGAAWKRTSKNDIEYLTIRLKLTRTRLQELLDNSTEEELSVDLVAFPNRTNNGNARRPVLRIYEELT